MSLSSPTSLSSLSSLWAQDKIKAGAYRCKSCDFDCCVKCFLKKDISKAEGQVRGDKGLKNVEEVKTSAYAWRAIGFCRPHWYYIAIAVVFLTWA